MSIIPFVSVVIFSPRTVILRQPVAVLVWLPVLKNRHAFFQTAGASVQVIADVVKKSEQVMTKRDKKIKNEEYERNMVRVEEELLMNKSIVMQWKVSKHVYFRKINHICTDRNILAELDEYAKNNGPFVTNRLRATKDGKHLEIFRKLVRIFEETEKDVPDYDWKSFRYITKNGQVVSFPSKYPALFSRKNADLDFSQR